MKLLVNVPAFFLAMMLGFTVGGSLSAVVSPQQLKCPDVKATPVSLGNGECFGYVSLGVVGIIVPSVGLGVQRKFPLSDGRKSFALDASVNFSGIPTKTGFVGLRGATMYYPLEQFFIGVFNSVEAGWVEKDFFETGVDDLKWGQTYIGLCTGVHFGRLLHRIDCGVWSVRSVSEKGNDVRFISSGFAPRLSYSCGVTF